MCANYKEGYGVGGSTCGRWGAYIDGEMLVVTLIKYEERELFLKICNKKSRCIKEFVVTDSDWNEDG